MKAFLKRILPASILQLLKNRKEQKFRNKPIDEVFTSIYTDNHWQSSESISGGGSEMEQTRLLIEGLEQLFRDKHITSMLDIPCGDFNWMQRVDLSHIRYIGADIVEELIRNNRERYKERPNLEFVVLNLVKDPLPKSDLIFVRDCLVHLSYTDISRAIDNIKASGSKYLLTTTFTRRRYQHDITTGDWRPLNLQKKPFNFPEPLLVINENCTENNGKYKDKSMALWEIDAL